MNLEFSKPVRIKTKFGDKMLSKAAPDGEFWKAWRADKASLKNKGYSVGKDRQSGEWEVCLWENIPEEVIEAEKKAVEASKKTSGVGEFKRPEGLDYLPYQKAGIQYCLGRENSLIGDEMGLGKTIQAIGVWNNSDAKKCLVICPASLKLNWAKEFEKWDVKGADIEIINGKKVGDAQIQIVNYDIVKKHHAHLASVDWDLLICDESHFLKNNKALRTKHVLGCGDKMIAPIKAKRKLFLTGTPILNRPIELWTLVEAIDPESLGVNFFKFAKRYCAAHNNGYGWDFGGSSNLDELQIELRKKFMVRRLKKDVLKDLPAKRRQIVPLECKAAKKIMEAELAQCQEYEDRIADLRAKVELAKVSDDKAEYAAALADLEEFGGIMFEEIARVRRETAIAKIPLVIEHVRGVLEAKDKVLVFAHHHAVIDALVAEFGDIAVKLDGRDSLKSRDNAVERFQNDSEIKVFIGGIKAAGVGLTLTAASTVVFAELDWVPGNLSQAEDRCHRIGQTDSVLVQHLVLDGSIDQRLAESIVEKQNVIDKALDEKINTDLFEQNTPVFLPEKKKHKSESQSEIERIAEKLSDDQIKAIHGILSDLAMDDMDNATEQNGLGFNKIDTRIGKDLAFRNELTPKQAALGYKIAKKYHRQVPQILEVLGE